MNVQMLFESIGAVDNCILERSERTRTRAETSALAAAAACVCVMAAAVIFALRAGGSVPPVEPHVEWTVNYNEAQTVADAARVHIPGYFTEELSREELAALMPDGVLDRMESSGFIGFGGEGQLVCVQMELCAQSGEVISLVMAPEPTGRDYILPAEPEVSICGGVEYTVYEYTDEIRTLLEATCRMGDVHLAFSASAEKGELERTKASFKEVLELFADCPSPPDLSVLAPEAVPEWTDAVLSHEQALGDEDFGVYMLRDIPSGFAEESIRRVKNQTVDLLSGLWTRGYDELCWRVGYFDEAYERCLTSIADRENYDISLYPIPQAESVPEELWETVNCPVFDAGELTADAVWARAYTVDDAGDSGGYRMMFAVQYGDTVIEVRTKGIDPDWLYEQLISFA